MTSFLTYYPPHASIVRRSAGLGICNAAASNIEHTWPLRHRSGESVAPRKFLIATDNSSVRLLGSDLKLGQRVQVHNLSTLRFCSKFSLMWGGRSQRYNVGIGRKWLDLTRRFHKPNCEGLNRQSVRQLTELPRLNSPKRDTAQARRRQHAEYLASQRADETPEQSQDRRRYRRLTWHPKELQKPLKLLKLTDALLLNGHNSDD
ncbi:hypothetical protein EVAR_36713_1 [Eumeta japonica]|uniref:Uncharacterized protein n=1 Tax=Eumeta variegata TaxID=151549 RepID=A0A4C1XNR1_EUMVA|nr:hypothetical protein EVAR_36713_1 [Eumeta japonica]